MTDFVLLIWDSSGLKPLEFFALPTTVAKEHERALKLVHGHMIGADDIGDDEDADAIDAALGEVSDRLCGNPEQCQNRDIAGSWLQYKVAGHTFAPPIRISRLVHTGFIP